MRPSSRSPRRASRSSRATVIEAHTLVWGAGLQGNPLVQSLGLDLERGNRIGVGPELSVPDHPEVYAVGDIAAITDAKTDQVLPQLGSVALQSGEHAGETIARRLAGKETKPFEYRDKGTMATIGRGAAVVQMLGGRTMKGKKAQAAWGAVHLALLPTNEDRAKAVVDWAGSAFTHQRTGRITRRNRGGGVMADPTAEFFDSLAERGHEPLLEKATGTLRFDLRDGKKVDRWLVAVDKGDIAVSRRNVRADCVVSADKALFDRIASGKANALAAMLRGEMGVEGDVRLLVAFQRLLPGPPRRGGGARHRSSCEEEA